MEEKTKESVVTGKADADKANADKARVDAANQAQAKANTTAKSIPNQGTAVGVAEQGVGSKSLTQRMAEKQAVRNSEKTELLKKISDIEEEYLHNIGDIPRDHEYWDLLNAYRRKP